MKYYIYQSIKSKLYLLIDFLKQLHRALNYTVSCIYYPVSYAMKTHLYVYC